MADEAGFEIFGRVYPVVERWRVTDPVLIREVTGMEWLEFAEAAERMSLEDPMGGDSPVDQIVLAGMIAVSYWQANPKMTRKQVVKFMENLPMEEIKMVGEPEEPEEDGDEPGNAPNPEPTGVSSGPTPGMSTTSAVARSGAGTLVASGEPGLATGSQE